MDKSNFLACLRVRNNKLIDKSPINNIWYNNLVSYSDNGTGVFNGGAISLPGQLYQQLYLKQNILLGYYDKEFTVSFWMYFNETRDNIDFFPFIIEGDQYWSSNRNSISVSVSNRSTGSNWFKAQVGTTSNYYDCGWPNFTYSDLTTYIKNKWVYLTACYKNHTMYFFFNGELKSTLSNVPNSIFSDNSSNIITKIGNQRWYDQDYYCATGLIDDFCILNTCLWTESFTPPSIYLMDSLTSDGYKDKDESLYGYK